MLHGLLPEHQSLFLQFLGNGTVGFHHIQSCDELHVLHEISLLIHRVENRNSFAVENPHVIFTETGEVDEAGAAFIADILVVVNFPCVIRRLPFLREIEQRLIRPAFEGGSFHPFFNFITSLLEVRFHSACDQVVTVPGFLVEQSNVFQPGTCTESHVRRQGPGGGGPGKGIGVFRIEHPET